MCDGQTPNRCASANITFEVITGNVSPNPQSDNATTPAGSPVSGTVATNDTDPNNNIDPNSFALQGGASNGTIVLNANGTYTYTPAPGFSGTDVINYQVCDLGAPSLCSSSSLTITVTPPNAAPDAGADDGGTVTEDGADGVVNVLANDCDPNGGPNPPTNGLRSVLCRPGPRHQRSPDLVHRRRR